MNKLEIIDKLIEDFPEFENYREDFIVGVKRGSTGYYGIQGLVLQGFLSGFYNPTLHDLCSLSDLEHDLDLSGGDITGALELRELELIDDLKDSI